MSNAPVIHVGSDTRAKSQADALRDAEFAIKETGLEVSFTSGPHIAGTGMLDGSPVSVLVTCLPVGGEPSSRLSASARTAVRRSRPATGSAPSRWARPAKSARVATAGGTPR